MESIFDDSKRLARLLGSIKVNYKQRPLTPIQVANELKLVCETELNGDKKEAQRRFDLSESMWSGFMRLLTLSPEIQDTVIWGESDKESLGLGFTAAHFMAKFDEKDQNAIMDMSWQNEKPLRKDEIKELHQWMNENPNKTIQECIQEIFDYRVTSKKEVMHYFISGLESEIFDLLEMKAKKNKVPIQDFAKEIFSRRFRTNSVLSVKPHKDWVRITFSGPGRRQLDEIMITEGVDKNDIVNHIFIQEEF